MRIARLALAVGLSFSAGSALASDLVGTWEGKVTCKAVTPSGEKIRSQRRDTLQISEVESLGHATRLNVRLGETVLASARALDRGRIDSGKGAGGIATCGSNDDAWQGRAILDHFTFKVNASNGKGSLMMRSLRNEVAIDGNLARCTGRWKRVSSADPEVPGCPD